MKENTTIKKIEEVFQYSLLVAGELDDFMYARLGPIHLLKYLYLADYFYAKRNSGESFSGIEWQFYNFGPWSSLAHSRIDYSMKGINAIKHQFESEYSDDDFLRFEKRDKFLLEQIERVIPPVVSRNLKVYIKKFGSNTADLLNYVYSTEPMLETSPNEKIDLSSLGKHLDQLKTNEYLEMSIEVKLSNKKKKKIKEGISTLKNKLKEHVKTEYLIDPSPSPKYDEVFFDGISMLDESEVKKFEESKIVVEFDSSVWTSSARKGIYER
ncbi:hypothetical protein [Pseudoalteromonas sp. 1181_04]|uniref:hypothetical protein n=1 Tax=Pseudoalteromonas sp. 1181_04 TaxID=2604450 RepID=UPI004063B22D